MDNSLTSLVRYGSSVVVRAPNMGMNDLMNLVKHALSGGARVTILNAGFLSEVDREALAEAGEKSVIFDFVNGTRRR